MDHGYAEIHQAAMATTHQEFTVTLATGDTAIIPSTTKKAFRGPGVVTYRAYRDGAMDVLDSTATVVHLPRN